MSDTRKIMRFRPRKPRPEPFLTDGQRLDLLGDFGGKTRIEIADLHALGNPPVPVIDMIFDTSERPWVSDDTEDL